MVEPSNHPHRRPLSRRTGRRGDGVHRRRQREIPFGQSTGIVRRQRHVDPVPDIEPLGMVIEFFRRQRRADHEPERGVEILERKGARDGVTALRRSPALKCRQAGLAAFRTQRRRHEELLSWRLTGPRHWPRNGSKTLAGRVVFGGGSLLGASDCGGRAVGAGRGAT